MIFKEDVLKILFYDLSEEQLKKFDIYFNFLIEYNQITNLTRITEKSEVFYKHFFDSITLINKIDFNTIDTLCDMGSGAGFPGIPILILYPNIKLTIIDSLGKRIKFLEQLVVKLNLTNVEIINDRIEDYGRNNQLKFDLVTARALGSMPLILEMALPMMKINGIFVAFKSAKYKDEIKQSGQAMKLLGGKLKHVYESELPHDHGFRSYVVIEKTKHTQGFPRQFAQMIKKPL
jgi:16S rRNA (guanine527-N7)-methyltransferase